LTTRESRGYKWGYIGHSKKYTPKMLIDTSIKNAKPNADKPYKLTDEKGLYVHIFPNGSKYFRLKYRFNGKENVLALGTYPCEND
jgi:hypothetical protein